MSSLPRSRSSSSLVVPGASIRTQNSVDESIKRQQLQSRPPSPSSSGVIGSEGVQLKVRDDGNSTPPSLQGNPTQGTFRRSNTAPVIRSSAENLSGQRSRMDGEQPKQPSAVLGAIEKEAVKPAADAQKPAADAQKPVADAQKPVAPATQPAATAAKPPVAVEQNAAKQKSVTIVNNVSINAPESTVSTTGKPSDSQPSVNGKQKAKTENPTTPPPVKNNGNANVAKKPVIATPGAPGVPPLPGAYGVGMDPYSQSMLSMTGQGQAAFLKAQGDLTAALDRRTLPMFLMMPLLFSLICLFLGLIVSLYYIILLVVMVIQQSAVNAPLNIETVDYATIQSLNFFTPGQFNYMYFLLLPIATLSGIAIFTILANIFPLAAPIPRQIKGVIFVLGLSAIIMLFLQYLIYSKLGSTIKSVEKRLSFFNRYVCTKIYKNMKFLALLETPQASIVGTHATMQKSVELFNETSTAYDMAQGFYTLSMFYHYQKISLRNPIIFNAFDLFKPSRLLGSRCQPGAYLSRYGTYIEDITESILRPLLPKELVMEEVEKAFILCNEWITNTNGYANTIYPEDAFSSFIIMAIITFLIQLIPMYLIVKFYQSPEEQEKSRVARILNTMLEQFGITTTQQEKLLVRSV